MWPSTSSTTAITSRRRRASSPGSPGAGKTEVERVRACMCMYICMVMERGMTARCCTKALARDRTKKTV